MASSVSFGASWVSINGQKWRCTQCIDKWYCNLSNLCVLWALCSGHSVVGEKRVVVDHQISGDNVDSNGLHKMNTKLIRKFPVKMGWSANKLKALSPSTQLVWSQMARCDSIWAKLLTINCPQRQRVWVPWRSVMAKGSFGTRSFKTDWTLLDRVDAVYLGPRARRTAVAANGNASTHFIEQTYIATRFRHGDGDCVDWRWVHRVDWGRRQWFFE